MANIVEVRNLKLGEGIPKICVPLVGKTNEEILEEAKFLKNVKFDLIEWRVDHYENVENLEKVKEIVKALREACHRILYVQSQSIAMNGIGTSSKIVKIKTWWEKAIDQVQISLGVVMGLSIATTISAFVYYAVSKKKEEK